MARMSVDDSTLRDPRIVKLARALRRELGNDAGAWPDFARRYALGALLDVWAISYDRKSHIVPADDVDVAALIDGFHASMVACGLAEHDSDGVYIRGARKRVAYLIEAEGHGRDGGRKSGDLRRKNESQVTSDEGSGNLIPSVPDAVSVPDAAKKPRRKRAAGPDGYQDCVAEFDRLYRDDHGGAAPTWNVRTGSILSRLVRAHGRDEVIRRMRALFVAPPAWIESRDMGTLSAHFDKLAATPRAPRRDVSVGRYEPSTEPSTDDRAPWEIDEP